MLHRHGTLRGEVLADQLGVGVQREQVRCAVHNVVGSPDYAGVRRWKQKCFVRDQELVKGTTPSKLTTAND